MVYFNTISNRQCTSFHATGCHFTGPLALRHRLSSALLKNISFINSIILLLLCQFLWFRWFISISDTRSTSQNILNLVISKLEIPINIDACHHHIYPDQCFPQILFSICPENEHSHTFLTILSDNPPLPKINSKDPPMFLFYRIFRLSYTQ